VAVAATEQAWLDAAQGKTTREIEALLAGRNLGDEPPAPSSEQLRSRVLRFQVAPETFALFREALQRLRRAAGGSLDDDAALLSMARQVLGGPGEDGRSSYQVSLTVCAACGSAGQQAGGELVPVGARSSPWRSVTRSSWDSSCRALPTRTRARARPAASRMKRVR
jgi:hypothetical protein